MEGRGSCGRERVMWVKVRGSCRVDDRGAGEMTGVQGR